MTSFKVLFLMVAMMYVTIIHAQSIPAIIPKPVSLTMGIGSFVIDQNTSIHFKNAQLFKPTATFFNGCLQKIAGYALPYNKSKVKSITFELLTTIAEEGYTMEVSNNNISIKASGGAGAFYAVQSLLQLLPAIRTNETLSIPAMSITDYPRFKWRGMHLDVSRHFFSPEMIKEYLDLLAAYKINVFHWHLTDGPGWRLEIKKYPKLTSQAAWRVDTFGKPWNWYEVSFNRDRAIGNYGGYYTQEQAKEIVAYAKARNITVVPEIEMPGHSEEVVAAYPQLACNPTYHFGMPGNFLVSKIDGNFCAGNDSSFIFIEDVLKEVMAIFPSTFIHVGGDEVEKAGWKACPKCQQRIKNEGLKNEEELQSYFMRRIEKFIVANHRKMIGWDEILEGGLAPTAAVMSWRGETGGIAAAGMQHEVVMTPGSPCYFDHYQAGPEGEPVAIGGFNSLKKVYDYEPIPAQLNEAAAKYVLGAQANMWTEFILSAEHLEYMLLPRMPALSEVLWTPKGNKDWEDFNSRLRTHCKGYEQKGIHYCPGNFTASIKSNSADHKINVTMSTEAWKGVIHYTTDGTEPGLQSTVYTTPIAVDSSMVIKASVAVDGRMRSYMSSKQVFTMHQGVGSNVQYVNPMSDSYKAGGMNTLTDGIRGNEALNKNWHGFYEKDLIATIDLGSLKNVHRLSLGCLQDYNRWVFLPSSVKFEISADGINYKEIENINNGIGQEVKKVLFDFQTTFASQQVRYIRVSAKNTVCPSGHGGAGKAAWIFADEIIVE